MNTMDKSEKDNVLANVDSISSRELAQYIINKEISIKEMMDTGELEAPKRKEILGIVEELKAIADSEKERILSEQLEKEKAAWQRISNSRDVVEIQGFINEFSNGKYYNEALFLLDDIIDKEKNKGKLLSEIENDISHYSKLKLKRHLESGAITIDDLKELSIPIEVIENLSEDKRFLKVIEPPSSIPNEYTEIYFWGLPGSGKTCTISSIAKIGSQEAILDVDALTDTTGSALSYFTQLNNIFNDSYFGILPRGTDKGDTQYIPIQLINNKKRHPLAIVDLSGEVFKAFHYSISGIDFSNDIKLVNTFERVNNYLTGSNKKVHFFIVDLSVSPDKIIDDEIRVTQRDYLRSLTKYLESRKIFKKSTEAVFIIASKSDRLSKNRDEAKEKAVEHLKSSYKSFYQVLKDATQSSGLNEGLTVIPFTMGDVYFNDYCKLSVDPPKEILEIIKKYTAGNSESNFLGKLLKSIKQFLNQ